jgi:hypothetical protein
MFDAQCTSFPFGTWTALFCSRLYDANRRRPEDSVEENPKKNSED